MNGLERWAAARGSDLQELKLLANADGNSWDTYFKAYEQSDADVPAGRSTAFHGMLQRGRKGDMCIPLTDITTVMEIDINDLLAILGDTSIFDYRPYLDGAGAVPTACLDSDVLPICLAQIRLLQAGCEAPAAGPGEDGAPCGGNPAKAALDALITKFEDNDKLTLDEPAAYDGEAAPSDNPDDGEARKKPARAGRRKTKYSLGKNAVADMLKPKGEGMSVREIRMFLLSMPDWKPQDIAIMGDQEVADAFASAYRAVAIGGSTLIVPEQAYKGLAEYLNGIEAYCMPKAGQAETAQE